MAERIPELDRLLDAAIDVGSTRRRRPLGLLIGAVVIVLVIGLLIGLGGGSPHSTTTTTIPSAAGHPRLVDLKATPAGWRPVDDGKFQISIPPGISAASCPQTCQASSTKIVVVGRISTIPSSWTATRVHHIKVLAGPTGEVLAGTHAGILTTNAQILGSLTRSPYAVALEKVTAPAPATWQSITFGGITFKAPGAWTTKNTTTYGGRCGTGLDGAPTTITLSTGKHVLAISCPYSVRNPDYATTFKPGVVVVTMKGTTKGHCATRNGITMCLREDGAALDVGTPTDAIQIGLSGSGLTDLRILDSIRPS